MNKALNIIGAVLFVISLFFDNFFIPQILIWHLIFWQLAVVFYFFVTIFSTWLTLMIKEYLEDRFNRLKSK